jgi:hypothetical protein
MKLSHCVLALFSAAALHGQTAPASGAAPRFQADINAFLKADSTAPPAVGQVEFIGSSIFRLWKTAATDMAPVPVFNRAFGGSQTPDVLRYMNQIVIAYRPSIVVYYCGSNDVNAGASASAIIGRIREFHDRLLAKLPSTRMIFVSVIRAPDKRKHWAVVDSVNAAIRNDASATTKLTFVDVNPALEGMDGQPIAALYLGDSLHYHPDAYVRMTNVVRPALLRAWDTKQ